jgi:pyruvate dehydrogenase E1 component
MAFAEAEPGDLDPIETEEWRDALRAVVQHRGAERASDLVGRVVDEAQRDGVYVPRSLTSAYKNTISPEQEQKSPGDRAIEQRLSAIIRWNALAIVVRANKESSELGGHIASFQSAATLYDIGRTTSVTSKRSVRGSVPGAMIEPRSAACNLDHPA